MATMTGAAARRERGRQEMREQILGAARRIVQEQGIEALTMRAVAAAIGYSAAALYEYFPAKEGIYDALYFEGAEGLSGRLRDVMAALPPEAATTETFARLGRAYRAYAHERPELYRLVLGTAPKVRPGPPPGQEADGFNVLVEAARRAVERGDFAPLPPPVIAAAAWAAVHGFVSLELAGLITGGPGPGAAPPSADAGRAARDAMFGALIRMTLFGFMVRPDAPPGPSIDDRRSGSGEP